MRRWAERLAAPAGAARLCLPPADPRARLLLPPCAASIRSSARLSRRPTPPRRICNGDSEFMQFMDSVRARLAAKGASEDVQAYVGDLLVEARLAARTPLFRLDPFLSSAACNHTLSCFCWLAARLRACWRPTHPPPAHIHTCVRAHLLARSLACSPSIVFSCCGVGACAGLTLSRPPVLRAQSHQKYHELLVVEENKRKALLDIIYNLEVGGGHGAGAWAAAGGPWGERVGGFAAALGGLGRGGTGAGPPGQHRGGQGMGGKKLWGRAGRACQELAAQSPRSKGGPGGRRYEPAPQPPPARSAAAPPQPAHCVARAQNDKRALETTIVVEGGSRLQQVESGGEGFGGQRDSVTSVEEQGEAGTGLTGCRAVTALCAALCCAALACPCGAALEPSVGSSAAGS